MAQILSLADLSDLTGLQTSLSFYPKTSFVSGKGFGGSKKPVYAYSTKDVKEGEIRLPFAFALEAYGTTNDLLHTEKSTIEKQDIDYRPGQREMINEVLNVLKKDRTCTLCANTGFGKTLAGCVITACANFPTVVLVNDTVLLDQWYGSMLKFTTAKPTIVVKNGKYPRGTNVYICHVERAKHLPVEIRRTIGLVIIDETPTLCNQPGIDSILLFTPKYIFGCSATPSRSRDGQYRIMDSVLSGRKECMLNKKKKKKYEVIKLTTPYEANPYNDKGVWNWTVHMNSLLSNKERCEMIVDCVMRDADKGRVLVMTSSKQNVRDLHAIFVDQGADTSFFMGNMKKYTPCQILVSNVQKCGTGFDESSFCKDFDGILTEYVWIITDVANVENIEQFMGRSRHQSPKVRQIVDAEQLSRKHWKLCERVHIQCGGTVRTMKLEEY